MDKEKNMNENGKKLSRKYGKTIAQIIFSIAVTVLLLSTAFAGTGIVKAEEQVVEESGGMSVKLNPEFSDLTYTVGDNVLYKQTWDSKGDWSLDGLSEGNITDSKLVLVGTNKPEITSTEADINSSEQVRYEFRLRFGGSPGSAGYKLLYLYHETVGTVNVQNSDNGIQFEYPNSTDSTYVVGFGQETSLYDGEYYRISVTLKDDSEISCSLYYDNYTLVESFSATNYTGTPDEVHTVKHAGAGSVGTYFDYLYISSEGSAPDNLIPSDRHFDDKDWKPVDEDSAKMSLNYEDMYLNTRTGDNDTSHAVGLDTGVLEDMTDVQNFDGGDVVQFMAQTQENNRTLDKESHFQGWSNLEYTFENNMLNMLQDEENVDRSDIEIIDYYIDDVEIKATSNDGLEQKVREDFADVFLEHAEENDWEIRTPGATNWEYKTVDSLLMMDSFAKMKIDGQVRYGHPQYLRAWNNQLTQTEIEIGGIQLSTDTGEIVRGDELREDIGLDNPFGSNMKDEIITGKYEVKLPTENADFSDTMEDIADKVSEESIGLFALHENSVSDFTPDSSMALTSSSHDDIYESFHATNLLMASAMKGHTNFEQVYSEDGDNQELEYDEYELSDNMSRIRDDEFGLSISLSSLTNNITDDEGNELLSIFQTDNNDNPLGKVTDSPLCIEIGRETTSYTQVIVMVMVVVIAVGGAIMWYNNRNVDATKSQSKKRK